jgi:hypothetical protein
MSTDYSCETFHRDFDVFLSHNSEDKRPARELKKQLEEAGISVWFDREQLRPGQKWQPLLLEGLQSSGSFIVALGPAGLGRWQTEEVEQALRCNVSLGRPIIPVFLPGSSRNQEFDGFLAGRMWVDFRGGFSGPLIDVLIWGITGKKSFKGVRPMMVDMPQTTKWILIAGSGGITPRPKSFKPLCERIGAELASPGFCLVTGGWDGVDSEVARSFAKQILKNGQALSGRLVQIMKDGDAPSFPAGRLLLEMTENAAWKNSIQRADAVVLVGGMGGTYQTGEWALDQGKPVLPLADTQGALMSHGDAYRFYHEIKRNWNSSPLSKLLSEDDFECLGNPIPEVVTDLIRLLKKVLFKS